MCPVGLVHRQTLLRGLSHCQTRRSPTTTCVRAQAERNDTRTKTAKGSKKKGGVPTKSTATCNNATSSPNGTHMRPAQSTQPVPQFDAFKTFLENSGLKNVDGSVILGDASMVLCTHLASEDLSYSCMSVLALVSLGCWIGIASLRGDYSYTSRRKRREADGMLAMMPGYSSFLGIQDSIFTWLFFTPVALCALASLVTHGVIDPAPVMHVLPGAKVAPELEVIVALSLTMPCWRGFYYAVRDGVV